MAARAHGPPMTRGPQSQLTAGSPTSLRSNRSGSWAGPASQPDHQSEIHLDQDRPDRELPPPPQAGPTIPVAGGALLRSTTMAKPPIRKPKKKVCLFCQEKVVRVDYKDTGTLRKFISDRGKIRARRVSGNCTRHQRDVATAIKNAREMALLPYTSTAR